MIYHSNIAKQSNHGFTGKIRQDKPIILDGMQPAGVPNLRGQTSESECLDHDGWAWVKIMNPPPQKNTAKISPICGFWWVVGTVFSISNSQSWRDVAMVQNLGPTFQFISIKLIPFRRVRWVPGLDRHLMWKDTEWHPHIDHRWLCSL